MTEFEADDVDPRDFRQAASGITFDSVPLTWRPSQYDCDVLGYKLSYNDSDVITYVPGGGSRNGTVTGLMPETEYTFGIQASTVFGDRPVASLTKATTGEDPSKLC